MCVCFCPVEELLLYIRLLKRQISSLLLGRLQPRSFIPDTVCRSTSCQKQEQHVLAERQKNSLSWLIIGRVSVTSCFCMFITNKAFCNLYNFLSVVIIATNENIYPLTFFCLLYFTFLFGGLEWFVCK